MDEQQKESNNESETPSVTGNTGSGGVTMTRSPTKVLSPKLFAGDKILSGVVGGGGSILKNLELQTKFGELLREMILQSKIDEPLVFRQIHGDWKPCKWTLGDWGDIFRNEKLSVRYGRQKWDHDNPQWESLCEDLEITWTRLIDWVRGEFTLPFENSSTEDIWMYYDYKYLPEVIHLKSEMEKDFLKLIYLSEHLKKTFSWSNLGFPDRNGDHSTLWIGTKGSYTNTHYDTYSCNLICQVYGRKTWLVFPPGDTAYLKPTRVPYEESSVYSQLNLASDKQIKQNLEVLKKCHPRKVTLEPGDVLFLPSKWWHFVRSEDLSISVNTWIELPSDHFIRVEEAVLRTIVSSFVNSSLPSTADKVLNPNEMDLTEVSEKDSEETLHLAAKAFFDHLNRTSEERKDVDSEPPEKKQKLDPQSLTLKQLLEYAPVSVEKLKPFSFSASDDDNHEEMPSTSSNSRTTTDEAKDDTNSCAVQALNESSNDESPSSEKDDQDEDKRRKSSSVNRSPTYLEDVLNAVGHPEVLKQIALQFLNNVKQRNSST